MTPGQKAWAWIRDYAYAFRYLAPAALDRHDPGAYRSGDGSKAPVLVLPGVYETWQFLRPLIERLHGEGHPVHVVTTLRHNAAPVPASADLVAAYLTEHDLHEVTILAHSKGGLIGKYVMLLRDPAARVSRMVAVATPFGGSIYARYIPLPSIRIFSPRDATTVLLGADREVNARITSIFGEFDPHIPGGSALLGARNVRLDGEGGHFRLLGTARLLAEVDQALATPPEPSPSDRDAAAVAAGLGDDGPQPA